MSHPNQPLFYTLTATNCYDCSTSVIGIFDSMRALSYRLQRIHSTCGDEYHIDCYHLSTAVKEKEEFIEQQTNRAKYQREEKEKEKKVKYYDEVLKEADSELEDDSSDDEQLAEQLREERLNVA